VIGRTNILKDSARTKNGFNQSGAPLGRILAANLEGELKIDDRISLNHRGRASDRVKYKCLEVLNT